MKTPQAIESYLRESLGRCYHHPELVSGTPAELDAVLHCLHRVHAEVTDRVEEFVRSRWQLFQRDPRGWVAKASADSRHLEEESRDDFADVLALWTELDALLGIEAIEPAADEYAESDTVHPELLSRLAHDLRNEGRHAEAQVVLKALAQAGEPPQEENDGPDETEPRDG
jgi:hypothetical protein